MKSKRLIFFSGGVESTYMLTQAGYNDTIVIVDTNIFLSPIPPTFHPTNAEKIVKSFGYDPIYFSSKIKQSSREFIHQYHVFLAAANFFCLGDTEISEVWTGLNKDMLVHESWSKILNAFHILHPTVSWVAPFDHMTKLEQWNKIPEDIKPLVSTCIYHTNCGTCTKCQEFQELIIDKQSRNLQSSTQQFAYEPS